MRAFGAMLPRLEAEERLTAIDNARLAAGGYSARDARHMIERLRRAAQAGGRPKAARPTAAMLAGIGIGVVSARSAPPQRAASDG